MPDGHDWTRTQHEACPLCGYDAASIPVDRLAEEARAEAERWRAWSHARPADAVMRRRPDDGVWSALEYCAHVRDAVNVFCDRIARMLDEDDPALAWWDHDAAVVEEGYNRQDPAVVLPDVAVALERLATALDTVPPDGWPRTGTRQAGEPFTVAGAARFVLHESAHHRGDATAVAAAAR